MLALGKDFSTASSCETELTRTGSYNHRLIFVSCMQGISSLGKSESPHNSTHTPAHSKSGIVHQMSIVQSRVRLRANLTQMPA